MSKLRLLTGLAVIAVSTTSVLAQTPAPRPPGQPPVVVITPPEPSMKAGVLTCNMSPSIGFVVGSRQSLACLFTPSGPYPPENYLGEITRIGIDIGITDGGVLAWAVFMPTRGSQFGSLAGSYGGVSGDLSFGVGVGGNILFGGSDRSITLQPFSVEGQVGVNLAVGVSGLVLRLDEAVR